MEQDTDMSTELWESIGSRVSQLQELNWEELGAGGAHREVTIDQIHQAAAVLRPMAQSHPLHIRGAQLRHAYTFGRGMNIVGLNKAAENVVNATRNQQVLFSVDAQERLNMEAFVTGNIFLFRNRRTNDMVLVPAEEISQVYTDTFDTSKLLYVERTWQRRGKFVRKLFPTSLVDRPLGQYDDLQVDRDWVVYHKASRSFAGQVLGIPESFGGAMWSVAYSKYLSDSASLTHILKQIAWRITRAQSMGQAQGAAMKLTDPQNSGKVGGTAAFAGDGMLQSVGVPSAQVDFNNGQPLAALVASSFGVPVIALIASPGATGGSYGAATTLDTPTMKGFEAVQDSWSAFYEAILRDLVPVSRRSKVKALFPEIDKDPAYRTMTSASLAYEGGAIWRDEYREISLRSLGQTDRHDGELPEKPKNDTPVTPGQGRSGAVPGGMEQDVTNHDGDSDE